MRGMLKPLSPLLSLRWLALILFDPHLAPIARGSLETALPRMTAPPYRGGFHPTLPFTGVPFVGDDRHRPESAPIANASVAKAPLRCQRGYGRGLPTRRVGQK